MNQTPKPLLPILLVDDEESWLRSLSINLKRNVPVDNLLQCPDSREVMNLLAGQEVSIILLDLMMPHLTGEELLPQIVEKYPEIPIIILSGMNQIEAAVRCIQAGAYDYYVKAAEIDRMINGVRRALETRELRSHNRNLTAKFLENDLQYPEAFVSTITRSERMKSVFRYVEAVSASPEPLLVTGESGTGKELIAKSYHRICCPAKPWVPVNVASLDDDDFAVSLFGQARGKTPTVGMVARARGGVLFLDEIGDLSLKAQIKLLRLVREGEYTPVGGDQSKKLEARIVCATNQNLEEKVSRGEFRKDLFYKLQTQQVHLLPLRERKGDLSLLLGHFFDEVSRSLGKRRPSVPEELPYLLATYHFPGNIQELRSMVFSAVANHQSRILSLEIFKQAIGFDRGKELAGTALTGELGQFNEGPALIVSEKMPTLNEAATFLVHEAMRRANNNQSIAAGLLGISRQALGQRLSKLRSLPGGEES